ncbi:hypothetical protein HZS_3094 [Henneguya salminicola]|uniref:Citrate synthase n=1 Tax=Henneguya salminicola TaxID=69463 RepID=A0A6G3MEQ1_HENSL|nr:hypothetical protein HZS_3094 [Henneguya salminicola]
MESLDQEKDWASNFATMLGVNRSSVFTNYMRLYMSLHSDHEGGNASSHTAHLVGSTLSDIYLSFAASMNALAGPLHGRANQEVVQWVDTMTTNLSPDQLSIPQIEEYCKKTLQQDIIPGFGHSVLRKTDPRYTILRNFASKHIPNNSSLDILDKLSQIVPNLLKRTGKVKNPFPNVDLISGTVLSVVVFLLHVGIKINRA